MTRRLQVHASAALLLGVSCLSGQAQEEKRPPLRVPTVANTPVEFAPPGWRVEKDWLKEGDLNGDGRPDLAVVITTGDSGLDDQGHLTYAKHALVLALRGNDGKLHRSLVSDAAVLDGNEGGVFGDPFDSLMIERGTVVISHYGGSRDRWGYTSRYRFQNGQWTLIGLTLDETDTLDPDHASDQDINLSTGFVRSHEKGESVLPSGRKSRKPAIAGEYYELQVTPVNKAPVIDGRISSGEWPGYTVRLGEKRQAYHSATLWGGVADLSAQLHAVRVGAELFLCAEVTDDEVTPGDLVRLVNKRGLVLKPLASKITPAGNGYVFEARYSLREIVKAGKLGDKHASEELESALTPEDEAPDLTGFPMAVSVEVVDVDNAKLPIARSVLSTRLIGSPYAGSIRIYRKGALVLVSDN
jgi:hypothetical protein